MYLLSPMRRRRPTALGRGSDADDRTVITFDSDLKRLPSIQSLRGLDWLNFLLADLQTGVGPFLAIYLADYSWNERRGGLALTIGGIAGIASQTPAGALVDRLKSKRVLIASGVLALAIGALLIAFYPSFWPVVTAQALIGALNLLYNLAPSSRLARRIFSSLQFAVILSLGVIFFTTKRRKFFTIFWRN